MNNWLKIEITNYSTNQRITGFIVKFYYFKISKEKDVDEST